MSLLWIFIGIGGGIGGYLPYLLGSESIFWSVIAGTVGSLLGIWLYKKLDL